ncbi:MFS transporter [Actinoallomurus purpureus]|uniref:MFS transporter n=1 Tax=Actinoallomurus purpureus TaxID=478114 RepID=UPI00209291CD|nr:MFS transporter [Actinoallomurus purpureus]MCO6005088.1 MFS transporter [Actinoallomurus purpureus]
MTTGAHATGRPEHRALGPGYKWIALSNTTLGVLMVMINQSIVLIALPNIFDGIGLNPLDAGNTSYLLWMMMGFMVVTAVLVVSFGRLGDMYGRVRMYNLGFAVFTVCSILLSVSWMHGSSAALWLIGWRIVQGIGGALLFANSTAIITDAFPATKRGMALGINAIAAIAGSFIGLILGGVLGPVNWHYVFLVSVPVGVFGTFWAYIKLHDTGVRKKARIDWWGNLTFAIGLVSVLVGITYGIQPYKDHTMGWTNPWVLTALIGGALVLCVFLYVETKIAEPLFNLSLFRNRTFTAGNLASLLTALGRGGLQFMLIIWLQGIWLPQHGYSFEDTPLWAGIYMIPLTVGFLVSAPLSGLLSDRIGVRLFTVGGALITALSFLLLLMIPVNFSYWVFAVLLVVNGIGSGMFASPNRAEIMNSVPADQRGVGAGMTATFQNAAMVLSIGIFFSLMVAGLSHSLPSALQSGLTAQGVPDQAAQSISHLPPIAVLFAAFLGYNPMRQLLGPELHRLPAEQASYLTGRGFFPHLITQPFHDGLTIAFWFAIAACVVAAIASLLTVRKKSGRQAAEHESLGSELAGATGEAGMGLSEPTVPHMTPVTVHAPAAARRAASNGRSGPVIAGFIHDGTGAAVPGAAVTVTGPDGHQLGRATTGPDGRYAIAVTGGDHLIIVTAPGRIPQAATVLVGDASVVRDFPLVPDTVPATGEMYGVVRSPQGIPVGGITTTVTDENGEVVATTVTDQRGAYRITGLVDGTYTLVAAGHRPVTLAVQVPPGPSLIVRVSLGD